MFMDNRHLKVVVSNQSIDKTGSKEGGSPQKDQNPPASTASIMFKNYVIGLFYLVWVAAIATSLVTMPMSFGFLLGAEWAPIEHMYTVVGPASVISVVGIYVFVILKVRPNFDASNYQ